MSSTTRWRGRPVGEVVEKPFPRRPSLSPTPLPSSPYRASRPWPVDANQTDDLFAHGLGLSGTSLSYNSSETIQPDHIYIDQHGGAHVIGAKARLSKGYNARGGRHTDNRAAGSSTKSKKRKNHTRSGSTIDDLANAAIATSPRFTDASPAHAYGNGILTVNHTRPATSHVDNHFSHNQSFDRPAKRIKSEKLPFADWAVPEQRPQTSHAAEYQSPRPEEAELLLGLRYAWGLQASPSIPTAILSTDTCLEPVQPPAEIVEDADKVPEVGHDHIMTQVEDAPSVDDTASTKPLEETDQEMVLETNAERSELNTPAQPATEPSLAVEKETSALEHSGQSAAEASQPANILLTQSDGEQKAEVKPLIQPQKKPRKIQPEVQAEVCSSCHKLQLDATDEDRTTQWIGCEHCKKWFHAACIGFKDKSDARSVDKFYCKDCEGAHGSTTFVRKSSRARTAIDYAGLNEGLVKSSDESAMHHYIQPIKDGRIKYLADDFARVRPELLTAEFWENMDGMKRPFVVPACWNPRFGRAIGGEADVTDRIDAQPMSTESYKYLDSNGAEFDPSTQNQPTVPPGESSKVIQETVIDTDQDYLDMVMPQNLTVRTVAELYGPEQPVPVIDVKSQETKGQFTLGDWADYYEQDGEKPIRNVISLEVSNSRLGRLIRRPRVVRDIDLEDYVWDNDSRSSSNKRPVQFYCLMSVADSYTDFHIDFGGSSVYYHILKGVKTFFFIPPEDRYLKKYEEWCNSDTQNDTWLGDLCGGNVTRVDLHEGDTAFIPAGWIHSVWTPEDSLVIGGNFLTRLDYELQLKVANIEKTTRVPQKFRYPFFQKVMWYALLKYLDEDPVPEEVLRDFHEDEEYRFLRANPIWLQLDDEPNSTEPGESGFDARVYPRSELKGLPALRDYLYRTARIHADLPVSEINKRQIDAVKASIPKGHGDPMQLIKNFAVWCAWKAGNEKVPEWVHNDFGGLLPELKEREKSRKADTFRVPPERVSARKARESQTTPVAPETASTVIKTAQTSDSDDSSKKRNDLKSLGTRLACEPCRKRRIKCRHREDDITVSSTSPAAIRPRAYSNISVDIPKPAAVSPTMNGHEQSSVANGVSGPDANNTDLAQAALATLHCQAYEPGAPAPSTTPLGSAKKGRSKACEECRKSKRRCVHDEYGRVDPAKAAEPSKPRGSGSAKRAARTSDDYHMEKPKVELEIDPALTALSRQEITDAMIDPALMGDTFDYSTSAVSYETPFYSLPMSKSDLDQSPTPTGDSANLFLNGIVDHAHEPVVVPPAAIDGPEEVNIPQSRSLEISNGRRSPMRDNSYSPITIDGTVSEAVDELGGHLTAEEEHIKISRHSSRPLRQVERHVPEDRRSPSKMLTTVMKPERRASSETSGHSLQSTLTSRRSSSNTSGTTHRAATAVSAVDKQAPAQDLPGRPPSRDSAVDSEVDADEKLARELHAAENGLRRRASLRV